MINALILATVAFTTIYTIAAFIARVHDCIVSRRHHAPAIAAPIPAATYQINFAPVLTPQCANVLPNAGIRQLKAAAKRMALTAITQQLFGKRYSLCNAGQLREAIAYALAQ